MALMDQLTEAGRALARPAASKTGLHESVAAQLIPVAMAAVMAALTKNASRPKGADALANALNAHDGGLLNDLDRAGQDDVIADGRKILGHAFGAKQDGIEAALAKACGGLDAKQVSAVLAMAAPAVLAALGRAKRDQSLNPKSLAELLAEQTARDQAAAPQLSGITQLIDAPTKESKGFGRKIFGGLFGRKAPN